MMTAHRLILSSSSKARRNLLDRLMLPFLAVSPDVDERALADESPIDLVKRLALLKATVTAEKYPDAFVIGCDQVGSIKDVILCKPLHESQAKKQLQMVSGERVRFFTGLCLYDANTKEAQLTVETYDVIFRALSDAMIEAYLKKEEPYHCAGSFQAEGLGITLIERFEGDDYTALIGLPLIRLTEMLEKVKMGPL